MHPEVLVIGGGVIGLSIARELHKHGLKRITLLEKGVCGEGASWAAAGMLSPQVEADAPTAFFDLCCSSRDLYPAFADELFDETGIDVELDQTGTLYLAFSEDERAEICNRFRWQDKAGLAIEILSENELRNAEPAVSDDVCEAAFFPNDWQVENRKLINALRRYAELNNIEIRENTHIKKLLVEGDRVIGAETDTELVTAGITVVATGAWTSLIKLGDVEMPVNVEPVRGQIIAFRAPKHLFRHVVCNSSGYLVPRNDGRILAGSTSEKVGFDKTVTDSAASQLKEMARNLVPEISALEVTDRWAGFRPFSIDGLPILGSMSGLENVFFATAHYRNGILLAPLTAELTAKRLAAGIDSKYFTEFGADRFRLRGIGTAS